LPVKVMCKVNKVMKRVDDEVKTARTLFQKLVTKYAPPSTDPKKAATIRDIPEDKRADFEAEADELMAQTFQVECQPLEFTELESHCKLSPRQVRLLSPVMNFTEAKDAGPQLVKNS